MDHPGIFREEGRQDVYLWPRESNLTLGLPDPLTFRVLHLPWDIFNHYAVFRK